MAYCIAEKVLLPSCLSLGREDKSGSIQSRQINGCFFQGFSRAR